ncbi:MAG: hypothetical protein ACOZQL_22110 [Myxococcota bacterium]
MTRAALVVLGLLVFSCGPGATPPRQKTALDVASFSLEDVNPASPRFGQQVSQVDYAGKVSGWYFGHSS